MEQALAYVCCSAEESRVKCRNIAEKSMNWVMYRSVRDLDFHRSSKKEMRKICRGMEGCPISFCGDAGWSLYAEKK